MYVYIYIHTHIHAYIHTYMEYLSAVATVQRVCWSAPVVVVCVGGVGGKGGDLLGGVWVGFFVFFLRGWVVLVGIRKDDDDDGGR